MGCRQSAPVNDEARQRSDLIEKDIRKSEKEMRQEIKLLFLGAGESGKSTVLKQFRMLYDRPMSEDERLAYREVILANTFQSLGVVLDAMEMMGLTLADTENAREVAVVADIGSFPEWPVAPHVAGSVTKLCSDANIQRTIERRHEYQLNDSAEYFFTNVERTTKTSFIPSDDDILRCRVKTTGISEIVLQVGQLRYRLLDVGGQRTERRKWLKCFDGVTVLLFMVAIQEFDQSLYEDESVNRMQESITLFESVANSRYFSETSVILFLNKIDLFAAKLASGTKLQDCCPDYSGPNEYEPARQYMARKFKNLFQRQSDLYVHFTCATDTRQIRVILASVNDTILRKNLTYSGLL